MVPEQLQGPLFTLYGTCSFQVALVRDAGGAVDAAVGGLLLTRTRIGLVIQAALKHPEMVEALGPQRAPVFMLVFGGGARAGGAGGRDWR